MIGKPSAALAAQIEKDETERLAKRREELGEETLKEMERAVEAAKKEMERTVKATDKGSETPPPSMISDFPITDASIPVTTHDDTDNS